MTVIKDRWWFNCKVNARGAFLHDLSGTQGDPFTKNVADHHPEVVKNLFQVGVGDAGGGFPAFLLDLAERDADAPGCSALVARE